MGLPDLTRRGALILALGLLAVAAPPRAQHVDHTATVTATKVQLEAAGVDLAGPCGAFAITERVAWTLRGEGAGLLDKPSGNNCKAYAVDIVAYPDGTIVDVLSDAGGANGPMWGVGETLPGCPGQTCRYRAAYDPGPLPGPGPGPGPTPEPDPLEPRVAALEAQVATQQGQIEALVAEVVRLDASMQALATQTAALADQVAQLAARPIPTRCVAKVLGIPVSCQLQ